MKRVFVIGVLTFIFFLIEFILFDLFGWKFRPNLVLLLIVFFNSYFGIRYSILTAVWGGILKDSFGIHVFGGNICSFVICAYMITISKKYFYQTGSNSMSFLIIFFVSSLNILIYYLFKLMSGSVGFREVSIYVLLPEVMATTIISGFVFDQLKKCVSRLSV